MFFSSVVLSKTEEGKSEFATQKKEIDLNSNLRFDFGPPHFVTRLSEKLKIALLKTSTLFPQPCWLLLCCPQSVRSPTAMLSRLLYNSIATTFLFTLIAKYRRQQEMS